MSSPHLAPAPDVIWHDVECGVYAADLPLWRQLAAESGGAVLELGCGSGRVALDLAGAGFEVTGVEHERALLDALRRRAAERSLRLDVDLADVREFELGRRFALILAPMQLIHLLGGETGRARMLRCARAHLQPGGRIAVALLDAEAPFRAGTDRELSGLTPDVREIGGWVYSSLPVEVTVQGDGIEVRRLRQTVDPDGALRETVDITVLDRLALADVEREAADAGLELAETVAIPATADHVGSTVAILARTG